MHLVDRLLAFGAEVRVLDSLDPQVHHAGRRIFHSVRNGIEGDFRDRKVVRQALQ